MESPEVGNHNPRVLLCIRHFLPAVGGAEMQALRLAQTLRQQGVQAEIVTGRYSRDPSLDVVGGVPVHRLFVGPYLPVVHELFFLLSLALYLIRKRSEYDVVHLFQTQLSALVAVLVARRLGKVVITRVARAGHTGDIEILDKLPGSRWILRQIARRSDAAVALSAELVAELQTAGFPTSRIHLIPNGVALPSLDPACRAALRDRHGLAADTFTVVFVGRLSPVKGLEFLLSAWKRFMHTGGPARLFLVGDGPLRPALEGQIAGLGLAGSVELTGTVGNVDDYLQLGDAFVLPSLTEGMSNALLEAMVAGLPVVASRTSGTVDIIADGRNGLLFDVGDESGLCRQLELLHGDRAIRTTLGRQAQETVRGRYGIDEIAQQYVELYRRLLQAKRLPAPLDEEERNRVSD